MDRTQLPATEADWIRGAINKYKRWIESELGVSLAHAVILEVENSLTALAVPRVLANVPLAGMQPDPSSQLRERIDGVQFPPGMASMVSARATRESSGCISERRAAWAVMWRDTPVALRFRGISGAVVALNVPYPDDAMTRWDEVVVCRRDEVAVVMKLLADWNVRQESAVLAMAGSRKEIRQSAWDDLVLEDSVLHLVKNDYESFFARESWFRQLSLPFRRGYLLYGPPGNGKTSVIRVMLSRPGMAAFTLNFFGREVDDGDLQKMFDRASRHAPALVVMEDIDRAFPRNQATQPRSRISLQQLLNSLDGLTTDDGIVVAATANDPTALDPAILRRPGRFDRVVAFPNPNAELRAQFFRKLNPSLSEGDLECAAAESGNFSFALLREAYILAGQYAYEAGSDIGLAELVEAISELRQSMKMSGRGSSEVGFGTTQPNPTLAEAINDGTQQVG
jgi:ATP-dependent 26S proteasome regulatory subunit